jgi:hypothetical protein
MAKKSARMLSEEIKLICDKRNQRLADDAARKAKRAEKVAKQIQKLEEQLEKAKKASS